MTFIVAPEFGELESHLATKIIEQDALKNQVEQLRLEKVLLEIRGVSLAT
ncbi:MAG TPA: hypothetical protein VE593_09100 [Nitrososphaeraceae archaeon]|nr:hypothetical protein [Nitrososphaeraceae archaeon]